MTATPPVGGVNPHLLTYQVKQHDTSIPPQESVLDALASPPAAGIAAEVSPDMLFLENTDPPIGAGGTTRPAIPGT